MKPNPLAGAVDVIKVPTVDAYKRRLPVDHNIVLPHRLLSALYDYSPKVFKDRRPE